MKLQRMAIGALALVLGAELATSGCVARAAADSRLVAVQSDEPMAVHDALEAIIDEEGDATLEDRQYAYRRVAESEDDGSAAYAYARAALAGRLAEARGLSGLKLAKEAATYGRKSMKRDPAFAQGAAQRLLGSLYAQAGDHIGEDSEEGLELLEALVDRYPDDLRNHLRLAEAFVALGDPEAGFESLCRAVAGRDSLRPSEQKLVDRLIDDSGGAAALGCRPT